MSDPGRRNLLSRMVAASVVVLPLATGVQGPAASQSALTEDELERISREIAIEAVKFASLRWPPNRFPLRVSFASGESLKQTTDCADQWQRQFEGYVQFINAKSKLLAPTLITDALDAYVFLEATQNSKRCPHIDWKKRGPRSRKRSSPETRIASIILTLRVWCGDIIEFASKFKDLDERLPACTRINPALDLAATLLPSYSAI